MSSELLVLLGLDNLMWVSLYLFYINYCYGLVSNERHNWFLVTAVLFYSESEHFVSPDGNIVSNQSFSSYAWKWACRLSLIERLNSGMLRMFVISQLQILLCSCKIALYKCDMHCCSTEV